MSVHSSSNAHGLASANVSFTSETQTPLGKCFRRSFISSSLHLDIPAVYLERLQQTSSETLNPLLRLEMTGKSVNEPVISEVSRLFDTNFKIVSAQMDQAGDVNFGVMLIELSGKSENYEAAIQYFISKHIKTEIIGYV